MPLANKNKALEKKIFYFSCTLITLFMKNKTTSSSSYYFCLIFFRDYQATCSKPTQSSFTSYSALASKNETFQNKKTHKNFYLQFVIAVARNYYTRKQTKIVNIFFSVRCN
jgi:hypothetical protein